MYYEELTIVQKPAYLVGPWAKANLMIESTDLISSGEAGPSTRSMENAQRNIVATAKLISSAKNRPGRTLFREHQKLFGTARLGANIALLSTLPGYTSAKRGRHR